MRRLICSSLDVKADIQSLAIGSAKVISAVENADTSRKLDLWYEFEGDFNVTQPPRFFMVVSYGHPVPDGFEFLTTLVLRNRVVAHVYVEAVK